MLISIIHSVKGLEKKKPSRGLTGLAYVKHLTTVYELAIIAFLNAILRIEFLLLVD